MKILLLYDYPPSPAGLATQGDLLMRGLKEIGVDVHAANFLSNQEKEWYYQWFKPDVVTGIGYWGHSPDIIHHPRKFGMTAVPWLVADGFIADYQNELNKLPLILVTSNWVKEMYIRDGIKEGLIEVLPVGCDTQAFHPINSNDTRIRAVRNSLGIMPDQLMILTIGGDGASKGSREVLEALAMIDEDVPNWKYVCKVWPQPRTDLQNSSDQILTEQLGLTRKVIYQTSRISREFIPYLIGACDIYAAPSRLEGFGMPQVEAGACGKPVISINAMGPRDTLIHGETAFLAGVAQEILLHETILKEESGFDKMKKLVFEKPRIVDYRASVYDIALYLKKLMKNKSLRIKMGEAGRKRIIKEFDYRIIAEKYIQQVQNKLGIK